MAIFCHITEAHEESDLDAAWKGKQYFMFYKRLFIVFLSLCFTNNSMAVSNKPLTWGYVEFAPYHFDVNGKVEGEIADQVAQIMATADLKYTAIELPNKRAKLYIDDGRVDFTTVIESFILTPANFLKSAIPIYNIQLGAICQKDDLNIRAINDLKNRALILIAGYSYGGAISDDAKRDLNVALYSQNHEQALNALLYNRADCFLGYKGPYLNEVTKLSDHSTYFYLIEAFPVYLYLNKNLPNAENIMSVVNQVLHDKPISNVN